MGGRKRGSNRALDQLERMRTYARDKREIGRQTTSPILENEEKV